LRFVIEEADGVFECSGRRVGLIFGSNLVMSLIEPECYEPKPLNIVVPLKPKCNEYVTRI
jgi:hypothetical protein